MPFSRCDSYRKDTCYYDEYIAIQYVLNKLEDRMTAFKYNRICNFFVDKVIYIIQLDKAICLSLKTVRGVQLSTVHPPINSWEFVYTDMVKFLN